MPSNFRNSVRRAILGAFALALCPGMALAEPNPATYWRVDDLRAGMKGTGRTVMVGTKLEDFQAEILGVMKDVSPGRDMILCRLSGLNLEHSGIIQGMSGSPIYVEGKLIGAVAYAWEFAKDPIAGVTPFEQMVEFARAADKKFASERHRRGDWDDIAQGWDDSGMSARIAGRVGDEDGVFAAKGAEARPMSGGGLGGMLSTASPLAATGFSTSGLAALNEALGPMGMSASPGGRVPSHVLREHAGKPLAPGSPLSVAMVTGDFDLSGIGTVTHVEGDRVYGFGHPMMSLGNCELPLMTGYIHTVYPRASVSMKMGSPLKVVGTLDTDVSTGVAGRLGPGPKMIPMDVSVKVGRYSDAKSYHVEIVRDPKMLPSLVLSVLTSAVDHEGNLPDELTATVSASIKIKGHEPITFQDTMSGSRFSGAMGPSQIFAATSSAIGILARNPIAPQQIEKIDVTTEIRGARKLATIESVRLESDRVEPGQSVPLLVTLAPYKQPRRVIEATLQIPSDLPDGSYEVTVQEMSLSLRRMFRNAPHLAEPRDESSLLASLKEQLAPSRTAFYVHLPLPSQGVAVQGQALPNLPGGMRAVFSGTRADAAQAVGEDQIVSVETPWVLEGSKSVKVEVARQTGLTASASAAD